MKKALVLLLMAISLNSCGEGCDDCCLGDPCWDFQVENLSVTQEENECYLEQNNINTEYNDKISEAENLNNLNLEPLHEFAEDFWQNFDMYMNDLIIAFQSEGGDVMTLTEKIVLLYDEFHVKIDALSDSLDIESQEWRDKARLLDLELVEGQVELFSAIGNDTEVLAIQFLEWYKENKQKHDENEDKSILLGLELGLEKERLYNELSEAIEALNCN